MHEELLAWYGANRRRLPWREDPTPYKVWLSELMCQQTRVETALPYFERFVARWPTVQDLAAADVDEVLAAWSGLGYYRRARSLHAAAQQLATALPDDLAGWRALPGVGDYTAGAVASIALGLDVPLVDGNVERVLSRLADLRDDPRRHSGRRRLWALAASLVPPGSAGDWNQALMELGARVCVPRAPRCGECPISKQCHGLANGTAADLPRLTARAVPREVPLTALVAVDSEGRVYLERRPDTGLLAGLRVPPVVDGLGADPQLLARAHGLSLASTEEAGAVHHVLTHRRLLVRVVRGAVATSGGAGFVHAGLEGLGVAALTRKLLDQAGLGPQQALPLAAERSSPWGAQPRGNRRRGGPSQG